MGTGTTVTDGSHRQRLGRAGETHAAEALRGAGYDVLERNWRTRSGEVDLIARKGSRVVFVEVKTVSRATAFDPAAKLNRAKRSRMALVCGEYLKLRPDLHACTGRMDLLVVTGDPQFGVTDVRWYEDAFQACA